MSDALPTARSTRPVGPTPTAAKEVEFDATVAFSQEQQADSPLSESLQQLPNVVSRGLVYLLSLMFVTALIYCSLARIPVIRSARAKVVPEEHLQQVQSDCEGILSRLWVNEGDRVEKGKILAEIDSREVVQQLAKLREAKQDLDVATRGRSAKLPVLQTQIESQRSVLRNKREGLQQTKRDLNRQQADLDRQRELARVTRELEFLQEREALRQAELAVKNSQTKRGLKTAEFNSTSILKQKGGVSDLQWSTLKGELELATSDESTANSKLEEVRQAQLVSTRKFEAVELQLEQQESDIREQIAQNDLALESIAEELAQKERELRILEFDSEESLRQAQFQFDQAQRTVELSFPGIADDELLHLLAGNQRISSRTLLKAPMSGIVGKVHTRNPGENVSRGQQVLSLIPDGGRFRAEILIANRDVGLLKPKNRHGGLRDNGSSHAGPARHGERLGCEVRLKFDAFPHVEHGYLEGELLEIVPEAEPADAGGETFYRGYVSLRQEYFEFRGERRPLMAGMTATAEIITEHQTILQMLLKPLLEMNTPRRAARDGANDGFPQDTD